MGSEVGRCVTRHRVGTEGMRSLASRGEVTLAPLPVGLEGGCGKGDGTCASASRSSARHRLQVPRRARTPGFHRLGLAVP